MRNIPTTKRIKIEPVITPGIYHSPSLGLISFSSDGENWITIADKNLGATQAWNDGDEYTAENCGGFFQTGNNYMFPYGDPQKTGYIIVDFSEYGPGNYYVCDTFWTSDAQWQGMIDNPNLWGGQDGTYAAMQGPCSNGFHVPLYQEISAAFSAFPNFTREEKQRYFKLTTMVIDYNTKRLDNIGGYPCDCDDYMENSGLGKPVRPFKNEPVVPTSERTVLYQPN